MRRSRHPIPPDPESEGWLAELRDGGAVRESALARLHAQLLGVARAEAFRRDLPEAEIHFDETGHFALETHAGEIGAAILAFLARHSR